MTNAPRLVFLSLLACLAYGQVATSRLDGNVHDESGAVIPGAKIVAVNDRTQLRAETTSNAEGSYVFPSLQPGIYTLTVEAKGFRKAVVNNIELNVSVATTQRFKLEVGQVTETVVVEAEAVRVQTTDAQIGRSVTLRDIDTLPQLGRSPIILAVFQPGVQIDPSDSTFSRVNGQRQGSNNATLDGIDVNDAVAPRLGLAMTANNTDSIGEFRIITNGAKAEYGRNAGGQVELITRSGTNRFSGNLFDYLRNTELNANNFFNNSSGVKRPKYIQNLFGGSLGGPIIKGKTFFFFNYQGSRVAQEVVRNRTVLTPEAKAGIFRWRAPGSTAISSFNIAQNDPRGKGVDPEMAKIFGVLPNPNNFDTGDGLNTGGFRFNNPAGSSNNQYTGKVDHNLWDGHRVFFRYSWFRTYSIDALNSADATFPGFPQGAQGGVRWGFSAGSDWTLTPTTVNELRVGHQSANVDFLRPGRITGNTIISNLFTDPYNAAFGQGRNSPVDEITDNLTKLMGNHTFKLGGTWRRTKQWGYNDAGIYPNVTLATSLGNAVPANIGPTVAGGTISSANRQIFESLYNDVLGRMNQITQTFYSDLATFQAPGTPRVRTFNFNEQGYFFQDDWKIRRNFTLNLGLRWEFSSVPSEAAGQQGIIDRAALINSVSQISNFAVAKSGDWYKNDFNNFAPRIGFAWDVGGNGKTAVRGAFGMFYDRIIGATTSSVDGATPGFSQSVPVLPNSGGTDVRAGDGIPKPAQPGAPVLVLPNTRANTISVFDPNLRTGYVNQFNLSVQRELARNTIFEVSYVGSRGVKLFMNVNPNQQRVFGEFLSSFKELQAFQTNANAPISAGNTMVRIFGSPAAAISNLGAANFTQGLLGTVATNLDRTFYTRYAAAGVSDFYLRNFPQYIELRQGTNAGRSYYNSAQFSIRRNMSSLQVSANYTFSKSIDNGSAEGNGYSAPIDSFNLALNRGRSDWDRPHTFNASATYVVPFGKGKRFGGDMPAWLSSAIGGWELGGLMVWQSGSVYTVGSTRSTINGASNSWANFSGSSRNFGEVARKGDGVYWMNADQIASFSFPAAGEFGSSGRNAFRGPRYFNIDLSLVKKFRLTENHAVTFRAEGYNALNNTNFANPSVSLTAPASFGKISGTTGGPRIYQMALRYDF